MPDKTGPISRRALLESAALTTAALALPATAAAGTAPAPPNTKRPTTQPARTKQPMLNLSFSCKFPMVGIDAPIVEKFALLKRVGFDGVELDSPSNLNRDEVLAATRTTGLPVHGVIDSVHWNTRLSDPDPTVRDKGRLALEGAIRDSKAYGGSAVLLVPGVAHKNETENHDQVWQRSIQQIRIALPLAARLGIHILIENVWNNFLYDPDGPDNQSPDQFIRYIDQINSPWVGVHFDIGNIQRYGNPAQWIRALGSRITKLDVKGWGTKAGFCKIGDGDVDWKEVRAALRDINYTGWASAEVSGGNETRMAQIKANMDKTLRS